MGTTPAMTPDTMLPLVEVTITTMTPAMTPDTMLPLEEVTTTTMTPAAMTPVMMPTPDMMPPMTPDMMPPMTQDTMPAMDTTPALMGRVTMLRQERQTSTAAVTSMMTLKRMSLM